MKATLDSLHRRIERLEKGDPIADMRANERIHKTARNVVAPTNAGLVAANIRQEFLIEIVRQSGILNNISLDKIADLVKQNYAKPTYGVSVKFAEEQVEKVLTLLKAPSRLSEK